MTPAFESFLAVISPPNRIKNDVEYFKMDFRNRHGAFPSHLSKAHISLGTLEVPTTQVSQFFKDLQQSMDDLEPYPLKLNGFDYFRSSRTIFVDVVDKMDFTRLVKKIELVSALHSIRNHYKAINYPHMTIARNLSVPTFNEAQLEYFSKDYQEKFYVSEVDILRYQSPERGMEVFTTLYL